MAGVVLLKCLINMECAQEEVEQVLQQFMNDRCTLSMFSKEKSSKSGLLVGKRFHDLVSTTHDVAIGRSEQ